ncbi:MAG: hypothetical protein WC393_04300 [Candidatus Nanoarchaeia archaeon]|jgi:hypothetical protein
MQYDARREKAIEKIIGNKSVKDFLIDGEYYGVPMNKELPANTEAWKLEDIKYIYFGAYDDNGFYKCCLNEIASMAIDIRDQTKKRHYLEHIKNIEENTKKENVWELCCLENNNANKIDFIWRLSAIKYPEVLNKYFQNYQNNPNNPKGSLEKNYSVLPWSLSEAKRFTANGDRPSNSAIYQFIKHLPIESSNNSFWLKDKNKLEEVLSFVEKNIQHGIIPEAITEIWNYAKVELPQAFEFNPNYSDIIEIILKLNLR